MIFDRREANAAAIGFLQVVAIVCAGAALLATCARAEPRINDAGMEVPTQGQIYACRHDAERFCGQYLVNTKMITAMGGNGLAQLRVCMQAHEQQLSQRCLEAFK